MLITVGLALIALGVLSVRGAAMYAVSPGASVQVTTFLGGQVATLLMVVAAAAGLILIINALVLGLWTTTALNAVLWVAIVAGAVGAWLGLDRISSRTAKDEQAAAAILPLPGHRPTAKASSRRPAKKRAA